MPLTTTMDETYAKIAQINCNTEAQQCLEKKQVPERIPTVSNKMVTAASKQVSIEMQIPHKIQQILQENPWDYLLGENHLFETVQR